METSTGHLALNLQYDITMETSTGHLALNLQYDITMETSTGHLALNLQCDISPWKLSFQKGNYVLYALI